MESANRTMEDTVSKSDLDARSASYPIGQGSSDVLMNAFASPQQAITTDEGIHAYPSQQYASSSGDICDYAVAGKQAMSGIDMNGHVFAAPFQPACSALPAGHVMTDEQLETLRRQIFVYATICQQLVEMHKAIMAQQGSGSGSWLGPSIPFDSSLHSMGHKLTSRQRWTPSQIQLHILEKLFEQESGTPNKQRIKEITLELSQHGQISETNVYNWFQNRRARTKRKQQLGGPSNGDSEFDTDADLPDEKKGKIEADFATYSFDAVPATSRVALGADNMEHQQGISNLPQRCGQLSNAAMAFFGTQGAYDES